MRLKKNSKPLLLIMLSACITLFGCKKQNTHSATPLSYSWWGNASRHEYTLQALELFKSMHPNITVTPEYAAWNGYEEQFDAKFKSGGSADVMQINFDWLFKYSPDGSAFYDLNELQDELEFYNFTLSDLEYGAVNGKQNAIPVAFNSLIPVFDRSVFEENRLSIPKTWDDLFDCARILKGKDYYLMGTGAKHSFLLCTAWFEQTHSKKIFSDNSTLAASQSELEELFAFYKRLITERVLYPDTGAFSQQLLLKKRIASAVIWCNEADQFADIFTQKGHTAALGDFITTKGATESGWYQKPVMLYAINKNTAHPKEAAALLNFLLNDQQNARLQKCDKGVPASNKSLSALIEHDELNEFVYTSLMKIRFKSEKLSAMLPIMEHKDVIAAFTKNAAACANGTKSAQEAAKDFKAAIEALTQGTRTL